MCFAPQWRALFRHPNFQKWSGQWCVLYILTSKCAWGHNGVHFFDISTSKSGPNVVCFVHFDLEMCFAPQRRALFRHLKCQKWSGAGVFCTFWLGNVLPATMACTFSTSQLPKVVRQWCVLYILTCKCASRHNGVQFFISHLASWLRTRRFSEPTFRPSGATNHWKNSVSRLSYLFAHLHLLSSDSFSSTLLSSDLSLLSASSLLCFSSVHIVGSLTSKLPSIIIYYIQLAQTKQAARPKPKKWKSEAQKQSQTVASFFFFMGSILSELGNERRPWSMDAIGASLATELLVSEVGRLMPCQFLNELMESKCATEIRWFQFTWHDMISHMTLSSHGSTEHLLFLPASAIKSIEIVGLVSANIHWENQKFPAILLFTPRSATSGDKITRVLAQWC